MKRNCCKFAQQSVQIWNLVLKRLECWIYIIGICQCCVGYDAFSELLETFHSVKIVFVSFCLNFLCSSLRKSLLYHYAVMAELCVWLAGLHAKYRSLVPEFLWLGPGSLQHFVLLTLGAVVFLTSFSSSTTLTMHQFVDSNTTHSHTQKFIMVCQFRG